jgi:hypothetical protein
LADEGGRFFYIGWRGVHRFMGRRDGVRYHIIYRSNVNWKESSGAAGFSLLISAI